MTYFLGALGGALGQHTIANPGAPPGAQTFDQWLASTNTGAGPAHYWSMDDVTGATMTADIGGLNGTYANLSGLSFEIPDAAGVKHIGFEGTNGHATILTPVTTAAFTLMWRIQSDTAPSGMTLATTGFSSTPGQFLVQLIDDGAGGHKPRVGSKDGAGASVIYVGSGTGSCPVGTVYYFFYIRTSSGGQEVWIVDVAAGTASQVSLTLDAGTAPGSWSVPPASNVFFFSTTAFSDSFDGLACRMALWDSAIPRADITALANIVPADQAVVVWARALDAGQVNESSALTNISILDHIHPSTGFTATIIDGTGTHGTLTTDGTDLTYTAGAVTSNQTDTAMSWRISKGGVNSPTVGFTIDVLETGGAPPASNQANCFVESGGSVVSSMAALQTAVNAASPGANILIAPNTYSGGTLTFNRDGTQANPIVIRPQNGLGTVTINGGSWTLASTSSWLAFEKLHMDGGQITLQGSHNRISRCRFRNYGGSAILIGDGGNQDCRIDHCDFGNPSGTSGTGINLRGAATWLSTHRRLLVDYCYFQGFTRGFTTLMFTTDSVRASADVARGESITFDHCMWQNCSSSSTSELVINKVGGMIYRFCTFQDCGDYFQWRVGNNCELRSCWFDNASDVHIFGNNCLIIGNRMESDHDIWACPGLVTHDQYRNGTVDQDRYVACWNSKFIGNRFGSGGAAAGHLQIGRFFPSSNCQVWKNDGSQDFIDEEVRNALIEANTRDSGGSAHAIDTQCLNPPHINTTFNATASMSFDPAEKLTASMVGLTAGDPLCPSGPQ